MELQPILHVWINHDNDLIDLTITKTTRQGKATKPTSEVIHTNKKHPFLTVEKGFLPVGQIKLGMHVVEANGHLGVISGWKVVAGVKTMYNLEVAQDHTFVVGVGQWVVHNSDCVSPKGVSYSLDENAAHKDGTTIIDQMKARGWTNEDVDSTLDNPSGTVSTLDNRKGPTRGDPATGYYAPDRSGYIVRNDKTGEVFSVSDRNDSGWLPFWDPKDIQWRK